MIDFEWEADKNESVKEAIAWASWLAQVADPGPCLLAAKVHAETFLKAYNQMSAELWAAEYGTP